MCLKRIMMVNNGEICLLTKMYFNLIPPVKFEEQFVNLYEKFDFMGESYRIEMLSLDFKKNGDIDKAKQIILKACGGEKKFYIESVKCIATLLKDESLDVLEASRVLSDIADSKAIDISIQFVGFYSEFIRLGMNKSYIVRFNKLLEITLGELQAGKTGDAESPVDTM